jgi:hypothetical protein
MPRLKQDFSKRKAMPPIYVVAMRKRYFEQQPNIKDQNGWRQFAKGKWDKISQRNKIAWFEKQKLWSIFKSRIPGYCGITSTFIINNCGRSGARIVTREKIEQIKKEFAQFKKKNPKEKCWTKGLKMFQCSKVGNEKARKKMDKIEETKKLKKKFGEKGKLVKERLEYWRNGQNVLKWVKSLDKAKTWGLFLRIWLRWRDWMELETEKGTFLPQYYTGTPKAYLSRFNMLETSISRIIDPIQEDFNSLPKKEKLKFFKYFWENPEKGTTPGKVERSLIFKNILKQIDQIKFPPIRSKKNQPGKERVQIQQMNRKIHDGKIVLHRKKVQPKPTIPLPKKTKQSKSILSPEEQKLNEGLWKLIEELNAASDNNQLSRDKFNELMVRVKKVYNTTKKPGFGLSKSDFESNTTMHWFTLNDIIESKLKPKFGQKIKFNGKKAWPLLWKSYQDILLFEPTELKDFDRYAMIGWKNNMDLNYD